MKYFVTYAVMDEETGANPLWHAFLFLSHLEEGQDKLEVCEYWGFYGVPSTTSTSGMQQRLKRFIGLDIDFYDNHGLLKREGLRFLNSGKGLHGVTFELTDTKFSELQQRCRTMEEEQTAAIAEAAASLRGEPKAESKLYPYEHLSLSIFKIEKAKALEQHRKPRLQPFDFNINLTLFGPSLNHSHTCKTQILRLLQNILTPTQLARLTENGQHLAVPRFSGKMEKILLHSEGPYNIHSKRDGQKVYYHDGNHPQVKVYWTLPPQEIEALSESTRRQFVLSEEYLDEAKLAASRLQALEWLFINAPLDEKYNRYKEGLLAHIKNLYEAFAKTTVKPPDIPLRGWKGYALWLLNVPRSRNEAELLKKIQQARLFLNALYMTMVDGIAINDDYPCELDVSEMDEDIDYNPLEALASHLPHQLQRQLCKIIGRNYIDPENAPIQHLPRPSSLSDNLGLY
ncbi:hypothetical protein [Legionella nagasakiensis]|uniref:hypothetical protein n=1 Tax=Legionella nagasakiensis TaxID=535290 RepID=UPI0013EF8BBB|nr:hypothetical protein [Legionella nagasakiensis]